MTTAADLLQALRARMPAKLILDRRTGLPYGWAIWMRNRDDAAAPFNDDQVMDVLLARPSAAHGAGAAATLTPFQAFRSLWWQHWEPRPTDQRRQHWLALLGSLLIHIGFIALLIWVVTVRWAPDDTKPGEESRVRMTFIGDGAAEQGGGQAEPSAAAQAASADAAAAQQASAGAAPGESAQPTTPASVPPQAAAEPVDATSTAQAQESAPEPVTAAASEPVTPEVPQVTVQVPEVTIESPLQVTETAVATNEFVVPPPPSITVAPRAMTPTAPQVEVRQREIQTVTDRPQLRELQRPAAAVAVRSADAPSVREREVVVPDRPQVAAPTMRPREVTPTVRMPEVAVRTTELPNVPEPASTPAPVPPTAPATAAPTSAPPTSTANASVPQPASATSAPQATASSAKSEQSSNSAAAASSSTKPATNTAAGPAAADRSGGWDVAANADDWSKSDRNRRGETTGANGQRDGMFNSDGSVRVAGAGDAGKGAGDRGPPGSDTDTWTRDQIAQGGTWLKRPPYGYTPTSLDKYWMPNQSLLQEWVRRGLKKIEIPIPGTTTKISCVVSLLQFGGGCGLSDPNLNDQPATARPPPDIPFKRELQEDKGAVRREGE
ncbi:transmembrane repetitive protein [Xanthomonas sp. WHRI 10064A]|uniref:transmembrane repetitive protein n=1 Tax=unclassified Xanthomonas TaxID=2643310 RepID=UPI002B22B9EE|nr:MULTISPECIES: transmembrane repetitive protein [unclassified Xanthomonas]MEA9585870.1 transmembrane repetitive protein [Xanthomonas sp. WHRI 10064B]MEA9614297.1 transmembrane repetitive protein [Xanthomonas sp. WHRI 10064A]